MEDRDASNALPSNPSTTSHSEDLGVTASLEPHLLRGLLLPCLCSRRSQLGSLHCPRLRVHPLLQLDQLLLQVGPGRRHLLEPHALQLQLHRVARGAI